SSLTHSCARSARIVLTLLSSLTHSCARSARIVLTLLSSPTHSCARSARIVLTLLSSLTHSCARSARIVLTLLSSLTHSCARSARIVLNVALLSHTLVRTQCPSLQRSRCLSARCVTNTVTVVWSLPEPDTKIDYYVLEYRRTNHEGPPRVREEHPWMVVEGVRLTEYTLTGLRFDTRYITFRVKASNKAVAGEFSEPVNLETHAFLFKLDSGTAHQNLRVEENSVEWDGGGGKIQDIRKEKTRTSSPLHSPARSAMMSPKRIPSARGGRDRFTAESYTVLGDTMIDAGQHYWEVWFDKDSKAFGAGVALRSLGRFDQLGKSSASWCVHLNNWLQQSFTAKHNNKARPLDCAIPDRVGVYCSYDEPTRPPPPRPRPARSHETP
ncbi:hypothetical protein SKAU_G00117560, partial [Synaphobranchus kaupii]